MKLSEWVKAARTHKKLTQQQLGDLMGKTKGNVSAWEKGHHEPSFHQLVRISEVTGYPLMKHDVAAAKRTPAEEAAHRFSDLAPIEAVILEKIRRAISEAELPGFSLALDQLIEAKRLGPNTTDSNDGFSFYFARERRTHSEAVPEERREQWIRGPETGPSRVSRKDQR